MRLKLGLLASLLATSALAGPISSYPVVTPVGPETVIGTQAGITVNMTAVSLARTIQATTSPLSFQADLLSSTAGGQNLGNATSPWNALWLDNPGADGTPNLGGISFGPDMLSGYVISGRLGDLALVAVGDGVGTCHEIDMGTSGSDVVGTGDIVQRFNIRSVCQGQGGAVINAFESQTFPFATGFPFGDAAYPGIGADGAALPTVSSAANASGNVGTITWSSTPSLNTGDVLHLTGFSPTGWDGTFAYTKIDSTHGTITFASNVGTASTVGTTYGSNNVLAGVNLILHGSSIGSVIANGDGGLGGAPQFVVQGRSTIAQELQFGYDTGSNFGYIQAIFQGAGEEPLKLNPLGGPVVGMFRPPQVLFTNLGTADPSPQAGDMINITDASACTANVAVTTGSGTTHSCPTVYNGVNWIAMVTH